MQYSRYSFAAGLALLSLPLFAADPPPRLEYYRVAKGFVAEAKNSYGWAKGSGFAQENPWGQYTAFLMLTNAKGQRTWRIEHYLPWTPGPYVSIPGSRHLPRFNHVPARGLQSRSADRYRQSRQSYRGRERPEDRGALFAGSRERRPAAGPPARLRGGHYPQSSGPYRRKRANVGPHHLLS